MNEKVEGMAQQAREFATEYVRTAEHFGYYLDCNELEVQFVKQFVKLILQDLENITLDYKDSIYYQAWLDFRSEVVARYAEE